MLTPTYSGSRYTAGGISVEAVNVESAVEAFYRLLSERKGGYITLTGAHGLVEAQGDPKLFKILNKAKMTLPDGAPVALIGRFKVGSFVRKVAGGDFFAAVFRDTRARDYKHFFYGGSPEVCQKIASYVAGIVGDVQVVGFYSPPYREAGSPESMEVIDLIRHSGADVIWVGLSTPKQEFWMSTHCDLLPTTTAVGIGAVFDFVAGSQSRGAPIFRGMGLEWLYRLIREPKRLWPRYRKIVPHMLKIVLKEIVQSKFGKAN